VIIVHQSSVLGQRSSGWNSSGVAARWGAMHAGKLTVVEVRASPCWAFGMRLPERLAPSARLRAILLLDSAASFRNFSRETVPVGRQRSLAGFRPGSVWVPSGFRGWSSSWSPFDVPSEPPHRTPVADVVVSSLASLQGVAKCSVPSRFDKAQFARTQPSTCGIAGKVGTCARRKRVLHDLVRRFARRLWTTA
jgi:hypothetical protein